MRNYFLLIVLTITVVAVGCSSTDEATTNQNAVLAANSVNAPLAANSQIEMANSQRTVKDGSDGTTGNVKPLAQLAPENSEFTMTLTDVGTETRTFKNHRQLDKVVKTIKPGSSSIKVYLTNGKVVDVPGEKIQALKTANSSDILKAAGIKPLPPPTPVEGSQDAVPGPVTKKP